MALMRFGHLALIRLKSPNLGAMLGLIQLQSRVDLCRLPPPRNDSGIGGAIWNRLATGC